MDRTQWWDQDVKREWALQSQGQDCVMIKGGGGGFMPTSNVDYATWKVQPDAQASSGLHINNIPVALVPLIFLTGWLGYKLIKWDIDESKDWINAQLGTIGFRFVADITSKRSISFSSYILKLTCLIFSRTPTKCLVQWRNLFFSINDKAKIK